MSETKDLTIEGLTSGILVEANNHFDTEEIPHLLIDIAGWDDVTNKTKTTAPKGIGMGSYLISTHIPERVLSVVIQTETATTAELRAFRRSLVRVMLSDEELTLTVTITDDDGTVTVETLTGTIEGVAGPQNGVTVLTTITVKCLDPEKTIAITTIVDGLPVTTTETGL